MLSPTATREQEQAIWEKYVEESMRDRTCELISIQMTILVNVGLLSSKMWQLVRGDLWSLVKYQIFILREQNEFTKPANLMRASAKVRQKAWDEQMEPNAVYDELTKDGNELIGSYFGSQALARLIREGQEEPQQEDLFRVSLVEVSRWIKKLSSLYLTLDLPIPSEKRREHLQHVRTTCLKDNPHGFKLKF